LLHQDISKKSFGAGYRHVCLQLFYANQSGTLLFPGTTGSFDQL